jgi:hypothetical protein
MGLILYFVLAVAIGKYLIDKYDDDKIIAAYSVIGTIISTVIFL